MAAAWAVLHYLGEEGYLRVTAAARRACEELVAEINTIPEITLRAQPEATLLAIGATDPDEFDVFAVADALWRRGWYVDRQGPPASLHFTVNAVHDGRIPAFVADLRESIAEVVAARAAGAQGAYGTVD